MKKSFSTPEVAQGNLIRTHRLIKGWRQVDLAAAASLRGTVNVSQKKISAIERGSGGAFIEVLAIAWALTLQPNAVEDLEAMKELLWKLDAAR